MTAGGTLYIDEDCRDAFTGELNEWFGKEEWSLDGSPFGDYWDMENFPQVVEINVLDDNDGETIIGKVEIKSEYIIEDMGAGNYIEPIPKSIKLLEIKDKLRGIVLEKLNKIKEGIK